MPFFVGKGYGSTYVGEYCYTNADFGISWLDGIQTTGVLNWGDVATFKFTGYKTCVFTFLKSGTFYSAAYYNQPTQTVAITLGQSYTFEFGHYNYHDSHALWFIAD